ncbi:hypothetical protein Pint_26355 [Pistacia integerrima]|uniref:Uncharacterized protein n=1 Tax=Pistacia integerrima TaxID=434235 RepID=A0ACC0YCI4_9ROSI|nr:hypothetical protein Pint_26355 [Pistacia integerrima]
MQLHRKFYTRITHAQSKSKFITIKYIKPTSSFPLHRTSTNIIATLQKPDLSPPYISITTNS